MMSYIVIASLLLVASVSAEQPQEVSNVQTVSVPVQSQPSHVVGHTSAVESTGPQSGAVGVHHGQHFPAGPVVGFEQPAVPHYYSPAGMMQVVGQQSASASSVEHQQQTGAKPATVRHYAAAGPEQYGQPESASIPPNYKPFGSWGLYIGGNPADGYYSNYYKALTGSVASPDKPSSNEPVKPVGAQAFVGQASGFGGSPMLKQGPVYPASVSYQPDQAYPYGEYYTPADLNSGSRIQVSNPVVPSVYTSGASAGGSGTDQYQPAAMYYAADSYAAAGTKKGAPAPAFAQKEVQVPVSPAKGYHQQQQQQQQQRMGYAYAAGQQTVYQSPVTVHHQAAAPQVVAYPVPVGSQLVGSQPGVEGAFQPYGVHGFTRYAVKPTVVATEQTYYPAGVHAAPASQFPVYKQHQQHQQQQQHYVSYAQPLSFYGYPLSQLHYSSGPVAPAFSAQGVGQPASGPAPVAPVASGAPFAAAAVAPPAAPQGAVTVVEHAGPVSPVEAASSEKSETNSEANKQQAQPQVQKRA